MDTSDLLHVFTQPLLAQLGIIDLMANTKKKQPTKKQFFDVLKQVARKQQPAVAPKKKKPTAK